MQDPNKHYTIADQNAGHKKIEKLTREIPEVKEIFSLIPCGYHDIYPVWVQERLKEDCQNITHLAIRLFPDIIAVPKQFPDLASYWDFKAPMQDRATYIEALQWAFNVQRYVQHGGDTLYIYSNDLWKVRKWWWASDRRMIKAIDHITQTTKNPLPNEGINIINHFLGKIPSPPRDIKLGYNASGDAFGTINKENILQCPDFPDQFDFSIYKK